MIPTTVTIIPAAGHSDDSGKYTRGRTVDTTAEVDIVDQYTRTLSESLEEYGISFEIMDTRTAPGVKESERPAKIRRNSIVVELAIGWFENNLKRNRSEVYYYSKESKKLAQMVSYALGDWGKNTSFGHVSGGAKEAKKPVLSVLGTMGIRVEPFALNGPNYGDYLPQLRSLGHNLAVVIVEFMKASNPNSGYQPFRVESYRPQV